MTISTSPILSASFWQEVKTSLFNNHISPGQSAGITAVINEWTLRGADNKKILAYILATVYHETSKTMQPVEERGKGASKPYGRKLKYETDHDGNNLPYTTPDKLYYGRGLVQLTWYENYQRFGKKLKIDLLNNPELALQMQTAVKILFLGMVNGALTGVSVGDYLSQNSEQWVAARQVVNLLDKADDVASIAKKFYKALTLIDAQYQLQPKMYA